MKRQAGVLMAVSSLPSRYGMGCFSLEAYKFIDFLAASGQSCWQILPLSPTGHGEPCDSPYKAYSAFAGNPYYIDLQALIEDGALTQEECDAIDWGSDPSMVDYDKMNEHRIKLLRTAYDRTDLSTHPDFVRFCADNAWWLDDYALFMSLKDFFGDIPHQEWPEDIRMRWGFALDYYNEHLYFDIEFHKYLQYYFFRQWEAVKKYANERNIRIVGDIPIYVAPDSAAVWVHPELFQLDEEHLPQAIAGCPPDAFSATGQIWGNPLYRWDYHKSTGYSWWMSRLYQNFRLYDIIRIDHFRGFDQYYSVPADAESALEGHWEDGPGIDFFNCMNWMLGHKDIIAEDLGTMTRSVRKLVRESTFPNMKVIQFAFDPEDQGAAGDYLPHNYNRNCVVYTGTHDNDTLVGWFKSASPEVRQLACAYVGMPNLKAAQAADAFIGLAMTSHANICIIPIQDWLGLGTEARMNVPARQAGNWAWRMKAGALTKKLGEKMLLTTQVHGRLNWDNF